MVWAVPLDGPGPGELCGHSLIFSLVLSPRHTRARAHCSADFRRPEASSHCPQDEKSCQEVGGREDRAGDAHGDSWTVEAEAGPPHRSSSALALQANSRAHGPAGPHHILGHPSPALTPWAAGGVRRHQWEGASGKVLQGGLDRKNRRPHPWVGRWGSPCPQTRVLAGVGRGQKGRKRSEARRKMRWW